MSSLMICSSNDAVQPPGGWHLSQAGVDKGGRNMREEKATPLRTEQYQIMELSL